MGEKTVQVIEEDAGGIAEDLKHVDELQLSTGEVVNASGHAQEFERQFNFLSIASVGINSGNTWPALGGTIIVALYNGGPPGVIYEYLVITVLYLFVYASIAELASAIPSSAGVYHFASVTAGKYSRAVSFWAGWWNYFAWQFGIAATSAMDGNIICSMWALFHPDYTYQRWHVFVIYLVCTWSCAFVVIFAHNWLPYVSRLGMISVVAGVVVTALVCGIVPHTTGSGYASNADVWRNWRQDTGWDSDGVVFLIGMLNGAYSVGTPDITTHLAEEIPNPKRNVPRAIAAQFIIGITTAFIYLIALFYSINDLDAVFDTTYPLPIAQAYLQATSSRGGALGLLVVIFFPLWFPCIGNYITTSRTLYTLARDGATPASRHLSVVHPHLHSPLNATLVCGCVSTALGAIYVGSSTTFNALVGSFVILSTLSYLAAILPYALSGRRHVTPGPFYMKGALGMVVHGVSCVFVVVFIVIFCLPYELPAAADTMNYSCLISGGLSIFIGVLWLWKRRHGYEGPRVLV